MIFKKYEKTDRRILITALILFLLSCVLITNDRWVYEFTKSDLGDLEQIGEVKQLKNDVRRRHQVAFTWMPVETQNKVYQGDSIFTGQDSGVVITTRSGEELTIAANSLVVVKTRQDAISLDIGFGSVEGKVGKGKTLRITSNNSLTELAGDDAVVKVDAGAGDKLVLNVLSGEVKIKSPEGERTLRRNDTTEVDVSGHFAASEKSGVQILSPLAESHIRYSQTSPVEFRWRTIRKFKRMKIKVGTDPQLNHVLIDRPVDENSFAAYDLPQDVPLYWQVIAEGAISDVNRFFLVGLNPPNPIYPKIGQHFYYDATLIGAKAGISTQLQWDGGSPAQRYEVHLANNPQFNNPQILRTKEKFLTTAILPAGEYYWRVKSIDYPDTRFSEVGTFKIGPEPTQYLALPLADSDTTEFYLQTKLHNRKASEMHSLRRRIARDMIETFPQLKWSAVAGAEKYELQISRNKAFTDLLVNQTVLQNSYAWNRAELGRFYWRIRARSDKYKEGTFSPIREMTVQLGAPQNLAKTQIIDEVPDAALLDAPPPPLELKWNPTVFTESYHVQFANNPKFTNALEFFTDSSSRKVSIHSRGVYYWRVRSLDRKKAPLSPWSQTYAIEFQRVYKDPALSQNLLALSPRQQDSMIVIGSQQSDILFRWTNPYPDAEYTIEISYDVDFKEVAYRRTVKDNKLLFKEPLLSSVVYWRVRAQLGKEVTPWTGANRFLVSYESTPFDFETSEKMASARERARARQAELLAVARARLARLRSPAATVDIQLDTPQITFPYTAMVIESNLDPRVSQKELNKMKFESFFGFVKNYPVFTWDKVTAAERYFIEIARDPQFKNTVIKAPTFNPYYLWDTVRPGQYYWRVQAFNDRYTRSNFSEVKSFRVEVESPVPLSTDQFVEVFDEPKDMWQPPAPFTLRWSPVVFARGYDVEFSETPDFTYSKTYRTDEAEQEFRVARGGLYYWRVRPINENGVGIGPWTATRSVEIIQTQRGPASVRELTGLFPRDRTMIFVGKGLFNMLFAYTAPDRGKHIIEVSDSPDFSRILARQVGNGELARIKGDFPEGKLYWRVKAGQDTKANVRLPSSVSPVYEFILRKEEKPYLK